MLGATRKRPLAVVLCCALFASHAAAQTSGQNQTAAQALYDEARRLMDTKDFASACPKFRASYELDPGGGTLLNLADCYEKQGKPALAWSTFKEALVVAQRDGNAGRVDFAKTHLAALEPTLSYVTVEVPEASRNAGLNVTVDGTPLAPAAWGVAVPVDPGSHVIRAEASGKKPFERSLEIPNSGGHKDTISVPPLESLNGETAGVASTPSTSEASASNTTRTVGWVVAGAGVVGLGIGSFFGLKAMSKWSDRNDACKGGCTQAAKDAGSDASSAATISTVAFAVGAGALGVGVVLILTSGSGDKGRRARTPEALEASVAPTPGGATFNLRSTW